MSGAGGWVGAAPPDDLSLKAQMAVASPVAGAHRRLLAHYTTLQRAKAPMPAHHRLPQLLLAA